jgi:uncharacterized membrane protein YgcG
MAALWILPCAAADFKTPPTPKHHVTDTAGVLSDGTRDWVESDLHSYEAATGHQVIVATITASFESVAAAPRQPGPIWLQVFMYWLIFGLSAFVIAVKLAADARYGYLVFNEGSAAAQRDMRRSAFWGTGGFMSHLGFSSGGGGSGGGFSGGGFSAGGGSFGGGGASGSW